MSERTPEERERARLEREARRRGQAPPAPDVAPPPRDAAPPPRDAAPRPADPPPRTDAPPRQPRMDPPPPTDAPPRQPRMDPPAEPPMPPDPRPTPPPRKPRAIAAHRPHVCERVDAALARSSARRRDPIPLPPGSGEPPEASRPRRRRGRFLAPILAGLAIIAIAIAWFAVSLYQPGKGDGSGRVAVTIPRGSSLAVVADRLGGAGVIAHPFFFKLRARMDGHASDLKPGRYVLAKDMAYTAVIKKLITGPPNHVIDITIPEGRSRSEIAPLVKQDGIKGNYLRATVRSPHLSPSRYGAKHVSSLEGFLFPATYELKRGATVRALVAKQLAAFKQNFAKIDMSYARKKNLTPFDVVTIASMVEREAELSRERPLIAAVIYNRLKQGIPLGIDATIRFAVNNWTRPLLVSQLNVNSGYNTRTHQGLPPGPIGNPGLASLQAAAHPAHVNYLFYVVKPCGNGSHAFSSTDAQFQRDVAKYNAARAKKGGKSPEKC